MHEYLCAPFPILNHVELGTRNRRTLGIDTYSGIKLSLTCNCFSRCHFFFDFSLFPYSSWWLNHIRRHSSRMQSIIVWAYFYEIFSFITLHINSLKHFSKFMFDSIIRILNFVSLFIRHVHMRQTSLIDISYQCKIGKIE